MPIKDLTHEYIEFLYDCNACGKKNLKVVVDINSDDGGKFRFGTYKSNRRPIKKKNYYRISLKEAYDKYKKLPNGKENYDLFLLNCGHYA